MRLSRAGQLRPLLYSGNRAQDGFLLLRRETDNRYFIYLNLVPETSRFCHLTKVEQRSPSCRRIENLINMRAGEIVSFTSGTGCLFPIEYGRDYQDSGFLRCGSPLSAQLRKRGDRYEVQIAFEFKAKQIEPKTILGLDRGIYNLASLAVIDQDGGVIERKNTRLHASTRLLAGSAGANSSIAKTLLLPGAACQRCRVFLSRRGQLN